MVVGEQAGNRVLTKGTLSGMYEGKNEEQYTALMVASSLQ